MGPINEDELNELGEEFTARLRRGERPSISEYADRYSGEDAVEVEEFLDSIAMLENMKPDSTPSSRKSESLPASFGRYQIERSLGEGGMGTVYLAHDAQLDRNVALKTPKFDRSSEPNLMKRFYREARSAATLQHPNICPVYDVGEIDGIHYISMAYIDGRPLSNYILSEKVPPISSVVRIVRKVALALHDAHSNGLIHRDLKPANIMIDRRNEPIVMDFGLARQFGDGNGQESHASLATISSADAGQFEARLTMDGTVVGSPGYMAPEQLTGDHSKIGPASDIYALGVLLYELLTGQLPFPGNGSLGSMVTAALSSDPPDVSIIRPQVDSGVAAICHKALAKKPEDRFETMQAFALKLTRVLKPSVGDDSESPTDDRTAKLDSSTLVRTKEQYALSKSLYQEGQFAAAVSILEKMVDTKDQPNQFTTWANQQLPKARAKAAAIQTSETTMAGRDEFWNLNSEGGQDTSGYDAGVARMSRHRPSRRRFDRAVVVSSSIAVVVIAGLISNQFIGREPDQLPKAPTGALAVGEEPQEEDRVLNPAEHDTETDNGRPLRPNGNGRPVVDRLWRLDVNNDGRISKAEVPGQRGLATGPVSNLARYFDEYDVSPPDGHLDQNEMRRFLKTAGKPAKRDKGGRRRTLP